tara:strand:- start:249 stop:677 length:429 start_codon:yes stop_codon:yes gene_type:complete
MYRQTEVGSRSERLVSFYLFERGHYTCDPHPSESPPFDLVTVRRNKPTLRFQTKTLSRTSFTKDGNLFYINGYYDCTAMGGGDWWDVLAGVMGDRIAFIRMDDPIIPDDKCTFSFTTLPPEERKRNSKKTLYFNDYEDPDWL